MSRSRKKTPKMGWCGGSEKEDKQFWHRAYRRRCRQMIQTGLFDMPHFRERSSPWNMAKDGKCWFDPVLEPKWMRDYSPCLKAGASTGVT
jgi:hypothetical protein